MKVDIWVDAIRFSIDIEGNNLEAAEALETFATNVMSKGYYTYTSPKTSQVCIVPWNSITTIEQSNEPPLDVPTYTPERVNK